MNARLLLVAGVACSSLTIASAQSDFCATPTAIAGQGFYAFDNSNATVGVECQAEALCYQFNTSVIDHDVWYSWTADASGGAQITTCNGFSGDTKIAAYLGNGCPADGTSLACNDDSCSLQSQINFPVTNGATYMLQVGNFPGALGVAGILNVIIDSPPPTGTPFCFCDATAAPCGNHGAAGSGCANSAFSGGAILNGTGSASVGADSLVLSGSGLRPNQPGLYFQGTNAISSGAGIAFGDGLRCAGGSVIRLGVVTADAVGASDTLGFATSLSVQGQVNPGDLRHYQLWYRDPGASPCGTEFNLSNGYSVQW